MGSIGHSKASCWSVSKRGRLAGAALLAGGAVAGAALERALYRRVMAVPDPEAREPIGGVPGKTSWTKSFDGTQLYTRTYGPADAPASIVFAHGLVENHVIWHYLVRDLRSDGTFRLVAYDARGHGNSGPARGPDGTTRFDGHTLGQDLAAVVEQAAAGPVVLVGHSLGGMTALTQLILEKQERERVAGAVIVNSTFTAELAGWGGHGNPLQRTLERAGDVVRRFAGDDAKRIDRLRRGATDGSILAARALFGTDPSPRHIAVAFHMYETTPSQTLAAGFDLSAYDVHDALEGIDVPVLIVTGSRDILTPMFLSKEMVERIPEAELVVLEGCGHMAPFERYHELTALIRKFSGDVLSAG
jgi:pimeloyl-ACP methyl ester carboxylesterase